MILRASCARKEGNGELKENIERERDRPFSVNHFPLTVFSSFSYFMRHTAEVKKDFLVPHRKWSARFPPNLNYEQLEESTQFLRAGQSRQVQQSLFLASQKVAVHAMKLVWFAMGEPLI